MAVQLYFTAELSFHKLEGTNDGPLETGVILYRYADTHSIIVEIVVVLSA